jgi:hypothetical protein
VKPRSKAADKPRAGSAGKPRAGASAPKAAAGRGAAPARAALSALSTEALAAELARRRAELPRLQQQAAALRGQLAALESRIALLSGDAVQTGAPPAAGSSAAARAAGSVKSRAKSAASRAAAPQDGAWQPKRGPRVRRDGRPTLGLVIARLLGESRDALALREIAERAASALGRTVNPSFLVQTSQTLRKLVVRGAALQPSRGMYARSADAATSTKEGPHAGEPAADEK